MTSDWLERTRASYDTVAESYAELLDGYPADDAHDRALFALFAELVRGSGRDRVVDAGCGPGDVTEHLTGLGLDAWGLDLSPGMVAVARRRHPGRTFRVGSLTELDLPAESLGGVLLWYSLIHVPDDEVAGVLDRAAGALHPGGYALVGFHVGDTDIHKTKGYGGHPMDVQVLRRPVDRVAAWLRGAGLVVELEVLRDPTSPTPQGRVLARRP